MPGSKSSALSRNVTSLRIGSRIKANNVAAALYMNAARYGKNALAICTISDSLITGEALSSAERQESFTEMMELALLTAKKLTDRD